MSEMPVSQKEKRLFTHLEKLRNALRTGASERTCLRYWSKFVRERDRNRCVVCDDKKKLSAHHIVRKSFLEDARFETGNGITLCQNCHKKTHEGFNRCPDHNLPMDAQGGEKVEVLSELFIILAKSESKIGYSGDEFYFLSDLTLSRFKLFQGFSAEKEIIGKRVEQAAYIWNQTPPQMAKALIRANLG